MPFFQMDDGTDSELRVVQAGTAAFGLYARCGVWVSRNLTDGFVPAEIATSYGTREWIERLVTSGLWVRVDGGFVMPDFLDKHKNKPAEKVRAARELKAQRQARWLEAQKNGSSGPKSVSRRVSKPSRDASHDASKDNAPPLPSPNGEGVGGAPLRWGAPPPTQDQPPLSAADPIDERPDPPESEHGVTFRTAVAVLGELSDDDYAEITDESGAQLIAEGYRPVPTAVVVRAAENRLRRTGRLPALGAPPAQEGL